MTTLSETPIAAFETASRISADAFVAALNEVYHEVGVNPSNSLDAASKLGINKTLAWKLSKMIQTGEVSDVLAMLPGPSGMQILLKSFRGAGASDASLSRLKDSADAIREMVEVHVTDKPTLELVLDSMATEDEDRLALSRQLMFRGASGLWGVQAKTRLAAGFVAPSVHASDMIDLAVLGGYHDFRRLRRNIRCPLFHIRDWRGKDDPHTTRDPVRGADENGIFRRASGSYEPEITCKRGDEGIDYVLEPGPVGNAGAFDLYFGHVMKHTAYAYARGDDSTGEFNASIAAPTEQLVFDLFAHEHVAYALDVEALVFGRLFAQNQPSTTADAEASQLPISCRISKIPGTPPSVAMPMVPGYSDLVDAVYETMGHPPESFRAVRVTLAHPPVGSVVVVRFNLPEAPEALS